MGSHAARLTWSVSTWIVLAVAAFFLFQSEKKIIRQHEALDAFDASVRVTTGALGDVRHTQAAYVATGQNLSTWAPRIKSLLHRASETLDGLKTMAASADAQAVLLVATSSLAALEKLDGRIREYVREGQTLMAADIVFSESTETAADVARQVDLAQIAEHKASEASEAATRRLEAYAAGTAAILAVVVLGLLSWMPATARPAESPAASSAPPDIWLQDRAVSVDGISSSGDEIPLRAAGGSGSAAGVERSPGTRLQPSAEVPLKSMAELCTALARTRDRNELNQLLGRAAESIDATGVIVWLGSTKGADLRPVLASGFSEEVIARMPPVSRTADNAVAAAYRTGTFQVVRGRPGERGAVAAPVLSPDGCIGAFAAEIKDGKETSDRVLAIASLVAGQLATTLTALGVDQGSATSTAATAPSIAAILTAPVSTAEHDLVHTPRSATA